MLRGETAAQRARGHLIGERGAVTSSAQKLEDECDCPALEHHLTDREAEVLVLAAKDLRDHEIAHALGISARTVQQHIASMLRKADVHSKGGLIARCYACGVLHGPHVWPPQWSGMHCVASSQQH
jgi:DNA-binding CsgD family transcriptional regulator